MDNPRLYLWLAFGVLAWLNVIQWQHDYDKPAPAPVAVTAPSATSPASTVATAANSQSQLPALPPDSGATAPATGTAAATVAAAAAPGATPAASQKVRIVTDVLDLEVSLQGGNVLQADLLKYPRDKQDGSPPVQLLSTEEGTYSVVRSGLRATDGGAEPDHLATYSAAATEYRLQPGAQELRVPLTWTNDQGLTVMKTFVLHPGRYEIGIEYSIHNASTATWKAASYVQFVRRIYSQKRSMFDVESYAYRGPAIYDGQKYRKLNVDDSDDVKFQQLATGGWMAEMQHHFVSAGIPPAGEPYEFSMRREGEHALVSYRGPVQAVAAGASALIRESLFIGPKLQDQLKTAGPKLELTVDYGKLTIISQPLFWLLQQVHRFVGNWGLAIILVTALLKLAFYKLTETSGRSMAKMRAIQPRIKNIQDRYKDDREQLAKQMMELYKREKINPVAGCLPIVVQIPVFLAFYWVLLESVEMRQAPFFLWIQDLSSKDPFFILPIIMGIGMYGQFKLNPAPPDPMQAKMFAFMPVVMTVMMAWFPSGLVLYWITNTALSIAQQWNINRVVALEAKKT